MPRPKTVSDEEVMAATARAITRAGPGALTLADVAAEAGIAAPTLIKRFGSKRGLLLAFASQSSDGVCRAFERARARSDAPLDALEAALIGMTRWVRTREAMANNLAFLQIDLSDAEFASHAARHTRALREEIERLLVEAAERGELRPGADPGRLAGAIHALYNGALLTWALDPVGPVERALASAIGFALERERLGG